MKGLVDVVRLSPLGVETLSELDKFRANESGSHPAPIANRQCNGYWHQLAGLEVKTL